MYAIFPGAGERPKDRLNDIDEQFSSRSSVFNVGQHALITVQIGEVEGTSRVAFPTLTLSYLTKGQGSSTPGV